MATSARDKVQDFADKMDARLHRAEVSPRTGRVVARSRLRNVLSDCGFARRGPSNVMVIEAALQHRGVYTQPRLSTPSLNPDDTIYFSRSIAESPETACLRWPTESNLEWFLSDRDNFEFLFRGWKLVKAQFVLPNGMRVDLLARDDKGDYVVIELKKYTPDRGLVHQTAEYIEQVRLWLGSRAAKHSVRGLVITGEVNRTMLTQLQILATSLGCDIAWKTYRVEMTLTEVPTVTDGPGESG